MLEVEKVLQRFRDYVIQQSRSNLTKGNKNSTKELYNSIDGEIVTENGFSIVGFTMVEYGHYQDKGVSGTLKNTIRLIVIKIKCHLQKHLING